MWRMQAVEVDVEAELPDSYVSQTAEKLRLYRELDAMRSEEELQRFEQRLVDRFGALPAGRPGSCSTVVRLRWEAVRLGMEAREGQERVDDRTLRGRRGVALLQERGLLGAVAPRDPTAR